MKKRQELLDELNKKIIRRCVKKRNEFISEIEQLIEDRDFEEINNSLNSFIDEVEAVLNDISDDLKKINIDNLGVISDVQKMAEGIADDLY